MGSLNPDAEKYDDLEIEDSFDIDENLPVKNGLLKSGSLLSQKRQQCSLVPNTGKWLQIVKNGPKGSFSRATSFFDSKIPRHLVLLDEKYLRRCLELINISAFKSASCSLSMNLAASRMDFSSSHFVVDSPVMMPNRNVARLVFDLPFVDDSGSIVISPAITGCKRVTHKPLLHNLEAFDGCDDLNGEAMRDDKCEKGLIPSDVLKKKEVKYFSDSQFRSYESGNMPKKSVSLSSTNSVSSSSSEASSSCLSPSSTVSQGTLQFTMKDNKTPHFVFSLDDQKEIYVASLSTTSFDRSSLDYSYLIHLKKGRGSEPQHLVGKVKVSTLFSVSTTNEKIVERQFVLFNNDGNPLLPCHNDIKKRRGLPKKVVDALKSTRRASRQRSISRFSRTSSLPDHYSWEPFQEPEHDLEPLSLLDNDLPTNLETSAVVVREQFPEEDEEEEEEMEEKVGGWGMKFLKKTRLARAKDSSENSKHSTSIDVVIPSGIHGGPRSRNGGPSSLIKRWKCGGSCDCSGWDLGCPLTVFKGQARKDQNESQCNLFELFSEGSKQGSPGLRIMNVRNGLYFVQFQEKISVLQSFSIALAYIHSQSQRLRPWSSGKVYREA